MLAKIVHPCVIGESRLSPDMIHHADIYHTPFTPFPSIVRRQPGLRRFITVHDFNPLKFPEYFGPRDAAFMRGLLSCLTPDNFAFCVSETVRNDILNFAKITADRIFVTPLAADENIFIPRTTSMH